MLLIYSVVWDRPLRQPKEVRQPTEDIPRYVRMHKEGLLDIKQFITHRFSLDQVNEAFDLLRAEMLVELLSK